jgi:hypothetical protein
MPISRAELLSFTGADWRTRASGRVARLMRVVDRAPVMPPIDQPLSFRERLGLAVVFGAMALFLAIAAFISRR